MERAVTSPRHRRVHLQRGQGRNRKRQGDGIVRTDFCGLQREFFCFRYISLTIHIEPRHSRIAYASRRWRTLLPGLAHFDCAVKVAQGRVVALPAPSVIGGHAPEIDVVNIQAFRCLALGAGNFRPPHLSGTAATTLVVTCPAGQNILESALESVGPQVVPVVASSVGP